MSETFVRYDAGDRWPCLTCGRSCLPVHIYFCAVCWSAAALRALHGRAS